MNQAIIILGAGVMQGPAIKIAKELGYFSVVLDGSLEAPCVSMADRFEQIDLKAKEKIESFARSLQNKFDRIGIMTAGTDFSSSVAWVAEKLGLPGIPYETALNASDKSRMRECFSKAGLPSPEFVTITNEDISIWETGSGKRGAFFVRNQIVNPHAKTANNNPSTLFPLTANRFPLVIKPVDNMGSRGCRRVDSPDELREAAKTAIGFSRSGRAIVEAFMDGPEFSVDAIVYHGEITICGLADRHIYFPPFFIEMGHTMPAVIEKEKQDAVLDTFRAGVRALGIASGNNVGAAKGDIKLTANGAMIGEIAARLSGGYMSGWTYPYSSGVQPIKAAIQMAMGKEPDGLVPVKNWTCAERAFISVPGTVKKIIMKNDELKNTDFFLRIKEGDKVDFPRNNVTKCGNIIASAPTREEAVKTAETAAKSILIKLDPSDGDTEKFLSKTQRHEGREENLNLSTYPPDAFELSKTIKDALQNLPETKSPKPLRLCALARGLLIFPFNLFVSSELTDYTGRTVHENLDAVRRLTGFPLQFAGENAENIVENGVCLGRSFWQAFIRGAYQGATYYIERLLQSNDKEYQS